MTSETVAAGGTHRVWAFVKTTLVGGLVFLVPLVLLALLGGKAMGLLRRLSQPLAGHLPVDAIAGVLLADALTILVLLLACFLAGLLAHLSFAHRFVKRAEAGVLWRIPGYGLVKGLTDSLDRQAATSTAMQPVLVRFDDYEQLAFEVDRCADGRRVIYLPSAPDPRAGSVVVVAAERVQPTPLSYLAAIGKLRALGHGLGAALSRS